MAKNRTTKTFAIFGQGKSVVFSIIFSQKSVRKVDTYVTSMRVFIGGVQIDKPCAFWR